MGACLSKIQRTPSETARPPEWKTVEYDLWFQNPCDMIKNILANPDLNGHVDYAAYQEFNDGQRQYGDVMSGNWAWRQLVPYSHSFYRLISNVSWQDLIAQDPLTHGSMFVPVILGSDKMTVSVATGQNDFYPLYLSIGNVRNHIRCA